MSMDPVVYKNLINGEWTESSFKETFKSYNPADTRDIVGIFQASRQEDATQAIDAAQHAFSRWSVTPPTQRAAYLKKAADLLESRAERYGLELTREEGKLLSVAIAEVKRAAATFRFYAEEGLSIAGETYPSDDQQGFVYSIREPLGVVSVITPWNFPISIPARKIAPALVTGNTVVFKPASETPLMGLRLVECLVEAGLPAGVLNFVTGSSSKIGHILTSHPSIRAVTFTGSTEAGRSIQKSVGFTTRTQMELGGKNPVIVMGDADIEKATDLIIKGGFDLTGQACTGTSRVVVMRPIADQLLTALIKKASTLRVGNGQDPEVEVGPLANASQLQTVLEYVEIGKNEGASLVYGGEALRSEQYGHGYFVTPALFTNVASNMRIAQEEIFGPVIGIMVADTFEEAVSIANDVEYGLVASIVTQNIEWATRFVKSVQAGSIKINRTTTGNLIQAPFGGLKNSSTAGFRESGRVGLEFFLQTKTVYYGY